MADEPIREKTLKEGRSGRDVATEYVSTLQAYRQQMVAMGKKLPVRYGKVNKTAVAEACGFARERFHTNPELAAVLDEMVAEIGLAEDAPPGTVAKIQHRLHESDRQVQRLQTRLVTSDGENDGLRRELEAAQREHRALTRQVKELTERLHEAERKLREYELREEAFTTNGRWYRP